MTAYVIGFDIGGTRLKSGAVTRGGRVLSSSVVPSNGHLGPEALVRALVREAHRIAREIGEPAAAVGLALPGAVDPERGVVLLPGRLKDVEGFALVPRLSSALGVPVVAENDGRTAIIAEHRYGLAKKHDWALCVTIGTGIGSGVLLDGHILRDPHLMFGTQLGHVVLQADGGRLCITGARGTADMLCSATALAMQVRDGLQRGIPSLLGERYVRDPASVDFEAVIEAVSRGDRLCRDELDVWTAHLGWLLVTAIHAYAPEIVVLSGGGAHGARHFLPALIAHVNAHVFRYPPGQPVPIVVSRMRDRSGVLGSAALAWGRVS